MPPKRFRESATGKRNAARKLTRVSDSLHLHGRLVSVAGKKVDGSDSAVFPADSESASRKGYLVPDESAHAHNQNADNGNESLPEGHKSAALPCDVQCELRTKSTEVPEKHYVAPDTESVPAATKSDDTESDDITKGDVNNRDDVDIDESVLGDEVVRIAVNENFEDDEACGGNDISDDADAWQQDQSASYDTRTAAHKYAEVLRAEGCSRGRGWHPKSSSEPDAGCNISASDFVALELWCGRGHLNGDQYTTTRATISSSVEKALTPFGEEVAALVRSSLVDGLQNAGLLDVEDVDHAHRIAQDIMPARDEDSIEGLKRTAMAKTRLPSLSTMRRRMRSGGLYEKLLLPSKVIRLQRKMKSRREKNVGGALRSVVDGHEDIVMGQEYNEEADAEGQDGKSASSTTSDLSDKWTTPVTAGIVLPSAYITRDFAHPETFKAIMSGVPSSDYWLKQPVNASPHFACTDLAMSPALALRPGAYGAEAPTNGLHWPDSFSEGSTLKVDAIGISSDGLFMRDQRLSVVVKVIKQPFVYRIPDHAASGRKPMTYLDSMSPLIYDKYGTQAHGGDTFWELTAGSLSEDESGCSIDNENRAFAVLGFHSGETKMKATILWDDRVWCVEDSVVIGRLPHWSEGTLAPSSSTLDQQMLPKPWIDNEGVLCVRIHLAVYTDDFVIRPNSSVGGVYFLYETMPSDRRSGAQATRIVGVSPVGCDSDVCVTSALHDFIVLETTGVLCLDPYGKKIRVFARVALMLADYVQVGHSTPCKGHTSLNPCTICAQHRGKVGTPAYHCGRSSSADLALVRTVEKYDAMVEDRSRGAKDKWDSVSVKRDMVTKTLNEALLEAIEAKKVSKDSNGFYFPPTCPLPPMHVYSAAVGPVIFDSYLSFYGGLDHCLILGSGKDTLDFVLSLMQTVEARLKLEHIILKMMRINGLHRPAKILSSGAGAASPTTSMTVSELASVLLFLPTGLNELCESGTSKQPFAANVLPFVFRHVKATLSLLICVFCPPRPDINTVSEADVHRRQIVRCARLAHDLIDSARACRNSRIARLSLEASKLQKPNLHRVLEIVVRWLPSVNWNCAHLAELLFEKTHGFMKRAFSETTSGTNEALHAMDRMRFRELLDRLVLETEPDVAKGPIYPCRDLHLSQEVREDPRVKSYIERMQASGTRGFTVRRDRQVWSASASKVQTHAAVSDVQGTTANCNLSIEYHKDMNESLSLITGDSSINGFAKSAYVRNTSMPHKAISVGQVITTVLRGDESSHAGAISSLSFGIDRVTLVVEAIAIWTEDQEALSLEPVILCYGQVLAEDSASENTLALPMMRKTTRRIWIRLDSSSRRAAAVVAANEGGALQRNVADPRVRSLVLMLPQDGFPLRLG